MADRIIHNPIFGDSIHFLQTASETNSRYSEHELVLKPGGANPPHYHKAFTATFTATKGPLGVKLKDGMVILKPNKSYTVQKNEVHNFFNPSNEPIVFRIKHEPGFEGSENMLRIMYGLARDGQTNKKGFPKNLYHMALIADMGGSRTTRFPSLLTPVLRKLAKVARKKGIEEELLAKYCK